MVKGLDNGLDREKPVRYIRHGRDEWREAETGLQRRRVEFRLGATEEGTRIGRWPAQAEREEYSEFVFRSGESGGE